MTKTHTQIRNFNKPKWLMSDITSIRTDYGKLVEVFTSAFYHKLISSGDHVVDAGANAGMHLFPMSSLVGAKGRVYAFEPNPKLIQQLNSRSLNQGLNNIELHQKALHKEEGHGEFLIYPDKPGLSHLAHDGPKHRQTKGLESELVVVNFCKLDQVVKDKITFIKSDLEGADFLGLQGAKETILISRPVIIFENGRVNASKQHDYTKDDYFSFFSDIDYIIIDIHGLPLRPCDWESNIFSYECIAIPCEDFRLLDIISFIEKFWNYMVEKPEIKGWGDCAGIGRGVALESKFPIIRGKIFSKLRWHFPRLSG